MHQFRTLVDGLMKEFVSTQIVPLVSQIVNEQLKGHVLKVGGESITGFIRKITVSEKEGIMVPIGFDLSP